MPDHSLSKPSVGFDESDRTPFRRANRERSLVLVVDDDAIALEVARERLERLGFEVATRDQSLGTSRWIIENKPDFVLLDLQMPALTGAELARLIRRHMTGIIVHSSLSPDELARVARDVGAIGGISKGLTDKDFAREISRLIRQARAGIEGAP
jgi:CheY-like chemotaxis protein